jgi:hypothetical protein
MQLCEDKSRSAAKGANFISFCKGKVWFLVLLFGTFQNEQNRSTNFSLWVCDWVVPTFYVQVFMHVCGLCIVYYLFICLLVVWGTAAVAQWLMYCATNRKVAGSMPGGVNGIFHWHIPSDRTMPLESTQLPILYVLAVSDLEQYSNW